MLVTPLYMALTFDGSEQEHGNYTQVVLVDRLRKATNRLRPLVSLVAREDALQQVLNLDTSV
jgi:type I restriction enzyme R subunit